MSPAEDDRTREIINAALVAGLDFPYANVDRLREIARQREQGWPDFHPEDYCHRCGAPNPSWTVDSDRFNTAMGRPETHQWEGIVCVGCFIYLHEQATGLTCTWKLVPETPFRPKEDRAVPHDDEENDR